MITLRHVGRGGLIKQLVASVHLSSENLGNLTIYRVNRLLNSTITLAIVYLIELKAVLLSAFPALSYLTSTLSAVLIRSTTPIRRRPGIRGLWARVHARVYIKKRPWH